MIIYFNKLESLLGKDIRQNMGRTHCCKVVAFCDHLLDFLLCKLKSEPIWKRFMLVARTV